MPTTTNYGWTTPADTDLVKDGASAIRTLGSAIDTTVFNNAAASTIPTSYGFTAGKNALLNGAFEIWQRGTSSSGNAYLADRWYSALIQGTGTFAQETTVVPTGSTNSIKFTASSTAQPGLYQAVETTNAIKYAGKTVVVSGVIAASTSTGFTIDVQHSASTDNSVTGTWTSITPTSGGTATATTTTFVAISGVYAIPSTAKSLRVRIFTTSTIANAVVVYFDNLQLEAGTTATAFQTATGNAESEFSACQRYYEKQSANATASSQDMGTLAYANGSTTGFSHYFYKVTKRTTPSFSSSGTFRLTDAIANNYTTTALSLNTASSNENLARLDITVASGLTSKNIYFLQSSANAASYIEFSAEL